jgi:hypothetical protein
MSMNRLALAAAGISMLLWVATPALAGHGHGSGNAFASGNAEKHGLGHHFGTSGKPHSNKHGALRGLDRANDVAGSHGQQGRTNAAAHQSEDGSSHRSSADSE